MKDENMFPTDRDTGRTDYGATPATRADAEQALRDFVSGTSEAPSGDTCEGLCPECAIELALKEAASKGLTPESPEFGGIFERIFNEGNEGTGAKVRFLGAHKIGEPMPEDLKGILDKASFDALGDFPLPAPAFTADMLDEIIRTMPRMPDYGDLFKPAFSGPAFMPLPLLPEPKTSKIGGAFDEAAFDEALREVLGLPKGERLPKPEIGVPAYGILSEQSAQDSDDEEDFERERREVVQDLAAAAADAAGYLDTDAGEDLASALRDIAALAFETYGG